MGLRARSSTWSSSSAVVIIGIAALACMLLTAMARLAITSPLLTASSLSSTAGDSSKDAAVQITRAFPDKAAGSIAISSNSLSDAVVSMWSKRDGASKESKISSNATTVATTTVSVEEGLPAVSRRLQEARPAAAASYDSAVQQVPSRLKYAARMLKQVGQQSTA